MVVLLGVVDAEAERHLPEEGSASSGNPGGGKVGAHTKGPLVCAVDEIGTLQRRPIKPTVGVGDEFTEQLPCPLLQPPQLDAHARGGRASRRVEHVAGELAAGVGRHQVAHPHPRDLMHLRECGRELLAARVGRPRREGRENCLLARAAHREDEGEAELGAVRSVELGKSRELCLGKCIETSLRLLSSALGRELTREGGLAGEVGVRAEQSQLFLL
mmetsp:Transcript_33908/g.72391  ORF Transcript_33908/g.72391 Transcript_33908/m.72391 type:complete len:216 (-) Transcript_33908:175-822(-)